MKHRDLVKALENAGFTLVRENGNHEIFQKEGQQPVPVPKHKEIKETTARAILKMAGLK